MEALARRGPHSAATVKDSYVGIWNYFHGQRQTTSQCNNFIRGKVCNISTAHNNTRAFSRSAITRSRSEPASSFSGPSSLSTQSTEQLPSAGTHPRHKRQYSKAGNTQKSGTGAATPELSQKTLEKLEVYQTQRSVAQLPSQRLHDWYMLRKIARGRDLDGGKYSEEIEIHGFITSQRTNKAKGISFYQLVDPQLRFTLQLIVSNHENPDIPDNRSKEGVQEEDTRAVASKDVSQKRIKTQLDSIDLRPHTPVVVRGRLACRPGEQSSKTVVRIAPRFLWETNFGKHGDFGKYDGMAPRLDPYVGEIYSFTQIEMHVSNIIPLNYFPEALIAKADTKFPPEQRHLQIRTDAQLRANIRIRSMVTARSRKFLFKQGFDEIETPLLFKSTPEGAREFIVPTRKPGMAYALPQSPQQYKQLLMASGISRYFQFAKCFRDEDMRTDRQPEFTQLDLEMSFASRSDVMSIIEYLVAAIVWPDATQRTVYRDKQEYFQPFFTRIPPSATRLFPILTYQQAMELYGSDKPDLRFQSKIKRIDAIIPSNLKSMLSSLEDPIFEMFKVPISKGSPMESRKFIAEFLDAPSSAVYLKNPAGAPGVTVYDPTTPLNGLAAFGHTAAQQVEDIFRPEPGNILIAQARPRTSSFTGGSTPLGSLRRDMFQAAVAQGLCEKPKDDAFVWVTNFPLFSPTEESEPGQGGSAGICSTHHPFTAPIANQDLTKLYTDPLSIIGDHYDLVINGVEVGGGSVRIHDAGIQELVFRDVLKMSPERIEDFRHLLDALSAGCPPHAGFALGFDRLMAVVLGKDSVKDVIAFPKTAAGEDKMVSSPAMMTEEQLTTYHLAVKQGGQVLKSAPLSLKA